MLLIFASFTSIMTVIGRIRIITWRWVGRVILTMLTTFFFFLFLFFFGAESDDDESEESDDDGSGSRLTSGLLFLLHFELSTDQVILLLSSRVVSGRVPIFSIFLFDVSRSNTSLVSNSESLINLRYANFSLIVLILP